MLAAQVTITAVLVTAVTATTARERMSDACIRDRMVHARS